MCDNLSSCIRRVMEQVQKPPGPGLAPAVRPFTVVVEGNIGSGKSTFLELFRRWSGQVEVLPEPVAAWRDLQGHNLLQQMYEEPGRWSFPFQTFAQLTFVKNHTAKSDLPVKMMERSIYSAKYCFVENLKQSGAMEDSEFEVLTAWFDYLVASKEVDLGVDLIIYLRTEPEVALERLKGRGRGEEHLISLDYIRRLHSLHEDWLVKGRVGPLPAPQVIVVDANLGMAEMEAEFRRQENNLFGPDKENDANEQNKNDAKEQNKDARVLKRSAVVEDVGPKRQLLKLARDN